MKEFHKGELLGESMKRFLVLDNILFPENADHFVLSYIYYILQNLVRVLY